jgi:arabinose-5-phosphate isomerase
LIERGGELTGFRAHEIMHGQPKTIGADALAAEAAAVMEKHRITGVLVVDEAGMLIGALNTNDLLRAKVI